MLDCLLGTDHKQLSEMVSLLSRYVYSVKHPATRIVGLENAVCFSRVLVFKETSMPQEEVTEPGSAAEANNVVAARTAPTIPPADKPISGKSSKPDETREKNKKALADALAKARAVKIAQSPKAPPVAAAKAARPASVEKAKLVRRSVTMPEAEYAQIAVLQKRMASQGASVKRSELMRAGLALVAALGEPELASVMARFGRSNTKHRLKEA
jgi:hypothetical protein